MSPENLTKYWCAAAGLMSFHPVMEALLNLAYFTHPGGYFVGLDMAEIIGEATGSVVAMVTATLLIIRFRRWALLVVASLQLSSLALYLELLRESVTTTRFLFALMLALATSLVVISLRTRLYLLSVFLVLVGLAFAGLCHQLFGFSPPNVLLFASHCDYLSLRLLLFGGVVLASATATLALTSFTHRFRLTSATRSDH